MERVTQDAVPEKIRRAVEDVIPQKRFPLVLGQSLPVHLRGEFGSRGLSREFRMRHVPLQQPFPLPVHRDEAFEAQVVPGRPGSDDRREADQ
jgi:hypothetical protein